LDRDQQHVWAVRPARGRSIPVASKEAALLFEAIGWQVTELPLSSMTEDEMRSIGIEPEGEPGD
jgi:hypothetical protein